MRGEADVGERAETAVGGERFHGEDIEADGDFPLARHAQERGLVHDGTAADVDEDAAGPDEAEDFFRHDADGGGDERGEFDDEFVFREERLERGGALDAVGAREIGGGVGREDGDGAAPRAEERDELARDGTETVEADRAAEERAGVGETVFPRGDTGLVQDDGPVRGVAQAGEEVEQRAFGDGAADGAAPVGDEEAAVEVRAGDEAFDRTGEIAHVAQAGRERRGEQGSFPAAEQNLGVGGGQRAGKLRRAETGRVEESKLGSERAHLSEHGLGEEFADFGRRENCEEGKGTGHRMGKKFRAGQYVWITRIPDIEGFYPVS